MQKHIVYLANSSGLKVGITRKTNVPYRWIDQGAVQALPIFEVATRRISGLLEVELAIHVSDKTNWRKMLQNQVEPIDMKARRDQLLLEVKEKVDQLKYDFGQDSIQFLDQAQPIEFNYPVQHYPEKIISLNFDKTPEITAVLQGIKGQYLIFDSGVLNMRKFSGYEIGVSVDNGSI